MKGILSVIFVAVALAATGCVSSVRTGAHTGADGLCQGIELEGFQVQRPSFLTSEEVGPMEVVMTLDPEHESLSEVRESIEGRRVHHFEDIEMPNFIAIRLFYFADETDAQGILDEMMRWRDEREWAFGTELSPARRFTVRDRQMYGYSRSWHHPACGVTVVRGWRVVVPVENVEGLYAIISGEWENVWHPVMSRAFDIVASSVSVESAEVVRGPCSEPGGESPEE